MIVVKLKSMISSLDITYNPENIDSIKKGLGKELSQSFFEFKEILSSFKWGGYVKGTIQIGSKTRDVTEANCDVLIAKIIKDLDIIYENKYTLLTSIWKIYCTKKSFHETFQNTKTLYQVLKILKTISFDDFRIYTNCGMLKTYHDLVYLKEKCVVTSIQYSNKEMRVVFENLTKDVIEKLTLFHLKKY